MSLLKALTPKASPIRSGTITESMLDGTYRVDIDGNVRRVLSSVSTPPTIGSQVVIGIVSGRETIIATGNMHGTTIEEVTING